MDERWQKIAALDLKSVRRKFEFKKGFWWRLRRSASLIETEYRQFLYLIIIYPGQTVVPWSRDLDDFWHQHILDTQKYAADCQSIMNGFIHHNPHLPQNSAPHLIASATTREMYKFTFADRSRRKRPYIDSNSSCASQSHIVFCESKISSSHHHSAGHHTSGHHDGGLNAGGHHAGGHHGGTHSSCGGHGGHGCGGHGCGGHGGH